MPLFFIVSGFFMHLDKAFQLKEEVRRLIVPYLATAVTTIFLIGLSLITFKDAPAEASIRQILLGWVNAAIYGAGDKMKDTLWPQTERIGAIWFLLALFWSHLIVHQAAQTGHGSILVLAAFIIGYLSAPKVFLPFSIQPGLCASLYVYIGAVTWLHFPRIFKKTGKACLWVVLAAIWTAAIISPTIMGFATCYFGISPLDTLLCVVGGYCGTLCVIKFSTFIESKGRFAQLLAKAGKISLLVLCIHLVEDNVLRWGTINVYFVNIVPTSVLIVIEAITRFTMDCIFSLALMKLNFISDIFSPHVKQRNVN